MTPLYCVTHPNNATIAMHLGNQVVVTVDGRDLSHDYPAAYQAEAVFFALCKRDDVEQAAREYAFREVAD